MRAARQLVIATLSVLMGSLCSPASLAQDRGSPVKDIPYASIGARVLSLDLYMPDDVTHPPLVVWVHGGAWSAGSKADIAPHFVAQGYAMASVDYRLSGEARFPAQVHDIKAAIRFLRASAAKYGYDADRIVISGSSAGGHLAALVGVTNGHAGLEGTVGDHAGVSSDVQAIVDYFGPTNFATILPQSTPHGLSVRIPALEGLIGGQPDSVPDLASLASPVAHVDAGDPPLIILHGDQDPQVPINQSIELQGAYERAGLRCVFRAVYGAAHGGPQFYDDEHTKLVVDFLKAALM